MYPHDISQTGSFHCSAYILKCLIFFFVFILSDGVCASRIFWYRAEKLLKRHKNTGFARQWFFFLEPRDTSCDVLCPRTHGIIPSLTNIILIFFALSPYGTYIHTELYFSYISATRKSHRLIIRVWSTKRCIYVYR